VLVVSSGWVSSYVITRDHQAASLPAGCGRGRHVIGKMVLLLIPCLRVLHGLDFTTFPWLGKRPVYPVIDSIRGGSILVPLLLLLVHHCPLFRASSSNLGAFQILFSLLYTSF
jgi:hypothetical protein